MKENRREGNEVDQISMKAWFLDHSGVAVQTKKHVLIFDYYNNKLAPGKGEDGFSKGIMAPEEWKGTSVVVLVSHRHADHYNQVIYSWKKQLPDIRYVVAEGIKSRVEAAKLGPGQSLEWEDIQIKALESTDEGVAYLVKLDGVCIYHAGDLNWWHWEGENEEDNLLMGKRYREQIDLLKGEEIDLAFVPVDPRQGKDYTRGIDYFMRTVGANKVMPIHFWGDFTTSDRLAGETISKPYRDRILPVTYRGQCFEIGTERAGM